MIADMSDYDYLQAHYTWMAWELKEGYEAVMNNSKRIFPKVLSYDDYEMGWAYMRNMIIWQGG